MYRSLVYQRDRIVARQEDGCSQGRRLQEAKALLLLSTRPFPARL